MPSSAAAKTGSGDGIELFAPPYPCKMQGADGFQLHEWPETLVPYEGTHLKAPHSNINIEHHSASPKSDTPRSPNIAPVTKSSIPRSPNAAPH